MKTPVFFDRTGKRWRVAKAVIFLLIACCIAVTVWMAPLIFTPLSVPTLRTNDTSLLTPIPFAQGTTPRDDTTVSPFTLSVGEIRDSNTAVIGSGPLVRVARVDYGGSASYIVDPFTNKRIRLLSAEEVDYLNGDRHTLVRYGNTTGKRIVLTFDDGPDAIYTPQILDILSNEGVRASFFVLGNQVVKNPEIARRIVREGHTLGNHTFSHINFNYSDEITSAQEINITQRITFATTNTNTAFFRPPYVGDSDQALRDSAAGIIAAQKLGYTNTIYDYDSNDWQFTGTQVPALPPFDGTDHVVLVHDGGGDRSRTVDYVRKLVGEAKKRGYTFASLEELYPGATAVAQPSTADLTVLRMAEIAIVWPRQLIHVLFGFNILMLLSTTVISIILATAQRRRFRPERRRRGYNPGVTIVVPAYNEERVLDKSIKSLIDSSYRAISIVIVDDGSSDGTWSTAQRLARKYKRVSALHQINNGKASALNNAIARSRDDIIICVDADTVFPKQTINNLVRHFEDPSVGAVAGVVKVGNVSNMLTRWQMIEYATSISIERNAQAYLNAITIVPGACGAWRRQAILDAGGFTSDTLAEDCDLTLRIQRTKQYRILQDNSAIGYTESPQDLHSFVKQRFRWTFGNIQALWNQRAMIDDPDYGWLGCLIMPVSAIAILMPLLFWPLLVFLLVQNIMTGNYVVIAIYLLISILVQLSIASIGLKMAGERLTNLHAVFYARLIYSPIRTYILYRSIWTILKGRYVGWSKLIRSGAVDTFGITKVR